MGEMRPAVETQDMFRIHTSEEGNTAALTGLTLAVAAGEVVVVLGPSGSGKTTLLRILAGLDRPSAGSVRVFGLDIARLPGKRLAAYRSSAVGYADQHYTRALTPELSAREHIMLRLALLGTPRRTQHERADELLRRVALSHRADARPHELSGGEQQRVVICAALAHRPRLLLADEPTGELDAGSASAVYELIGSLARATGSTAVIVSHDPESTSIADRVIHVRDGRVSGETGHDTPVEEAIVVARGGWLRVPEEFLRRAGIQSRAAARPSDDGIVIAGVGEPITNALDEPTKPTRQAPTRSASAIAAARDVEKTFGKGPGARTVFHSLTTSFVSGRLSVVTGPSGSGKTTLLHLLAGIDLPNRGELLVLGSVVSDLDRAQRAAFRRMHVALIDQDIVLLPLLTASENVELGLAMRGIAASQARGRAVAALDDVGLSELSDQRVSRLSAGERQRVAIARALAVLPRLLLADEPTAHLDEANALAVGALLARLVRESETTIICATHDPAVIEQADAELALYGPIVEAQ
jgi:ABC-type lipoprotein export system ATPase subunit